MHVIYILVDALSSDNVGKRAYRPSPTPFLDSLKEQSVHYENMYTQAPYTEAAFISNLCGENTLDHGGYLLGMSRCSSYMPSSFKERGYHTISTYSPYVYSKSYIKDMDEYYYSRVFSLHPLFMYRIDYFAQRYQEQKIQEDEICICQELLDEALTTWLQQLSAIMNHDTSVCMIEDLLDQCINVEKVYQAVSKELEQFRKNEKEYIISLFTQGNQHSLRNIRNVSIEEKQSQEWQAYLQKEYGDLISKIQERQNKLLKKNMKLDYAYLWDLMLHDEKKWRGSIRTAKKYIQRWKDSELLNALTETSKEKVTISAYRQVHTFLDSIKQSATQECPVFAFMHLEDFHLPSMFYSYDISNPETIRKEMEIAKRYVDQLPDNYQGNLLADLSAQYVDQQVSYLFQELTSILKENFVFVVSADHGYPCNYLPPRPIIYNSFYQENYHIPFIAYDGIQHGNYEELHSSVDIMPCILSMAGLPVPSNSYILDQGRDYVIAEYPGPGCPDISNKEIYYAIFDHTYEISCKVTLAEVLSEKHIVLACNLRKDPYSKKNIKRSCLSNERLHFLFQQLQHRHKQVQKKFIKDGHCEFYSTMIVKKGAERE